jgi:hypothetical protein
LGSATRQQIPKHCVQLIDQPGPLPRKGGVSVFV